MNSKEAIELLESSRLFYDSSMDLNSSGQAELLEFIQQLSTENEQLKAQLEKAIVPKFKIGDVVWRLEKQTSVIADDLPSILVRRFVSRLMIIGTDIICDVGYPPYAKESELFASQQEAEASLNQKEGE
jgi:hypothetical protein